MSALAPAGYSETKLSDPFEIYVGPVFEQDEQKEGRRFALRVDERHLNRRGVVHGGMLMTLADLTLGQIVWLATDRAPSVTLNMQTYFLKPVAGGELIEVVPQITRRTRSLVFIRGDFTVGGEIVMTVSSVWKLLGQG